MKNLLNFIFLFVWFNTSGQEIYRNPDVPLSNSLGTLRLIHIESSAKQDTANINIWEKAGTVAKYPDKFSDKFDTEIRKSIKYYDTQNFSEARKILESAIKSEPDNPFILNAYARACYYVDRETSFLTYQKLIGQLDSTYKNSNSVTAVDIWFREAYWKLGTLYMDKQEWRKAYYEISRFILSIQEVRGQKVYIQALEYLTECAFMSYDDKLAKYLANRVLLYDSKNEYANEVLAKIKK